MTKPDPNEEIEALRQRAQEFEIIFLEYLRIEHLIDHAAQGRDLLEYAQNHLVNIIAVPDAAGTYGTSAANLLLYVDPGTLYIIDANEMALDFLGYRKEDLLKRLITDLETIGVGVDTDVRTYIETTVEEHTYQALYRNRSGQQQLVQVSKRLLHKDDRIMLVYRLEDKSLSRRLWHELIRREQGSFAFQKRLQILNKVIIELSRIKAFDTLCFQIIKCAVDQLGFDRISIWFLSRERKRMVGAYGVDEAGNIRDEHHQSWLYQDTYIAEFLEGRTQIVFAYDESPIYNEKSEIIGYGWHISAPMLYEGQVIGVLTADNFRYKQPFNDYDKELLRLYAITTGELTGPARP